MLKETTWDENCKCHRWFCSFSSLFWVLARCIMCSRTWFLFVEDNADGSNMCCLSKVVGYLYLVLDKCRDTFRIHNNCFLALAICSPPRPMFFSFILTLGVGTGSEVNGWGWYRVYKPSDRLLWCSWSLCNRFIQIANWQSRWCCIYIPQIRSVIGVNARLIWLRCFYFDFFEVAVVVIVVDIVALLILIALQGFWWRRQVPSNLPVCAWTVGDKGTEGVISVPSKRWDVEFDVGGGW